MVTRLPNGLSGHELFLSSAMNRELSFEDRKENNHRARVPALEQLPNQRVRQVVDCHGIRLLCDALVACHSVFLVA